MAAHLRAREWLRLLAESAKRIRKLASLGDKSSAIELTRIASKVEYNAMELEREFERLGLPNPSPAK